MTEVAISKRLYHLQSDMIAWCRDNVGHGGWQPMLDARWHIESAFGNMKFVFKNEYDATMFALRWYESTSV